jgi:tRNA (guanine-N7-)-methyltransferase
MEIYRRLLKSGGRLHLKTDNDQLYQYTLEVVHEMAGLSELKSTDNLYQSTLMDPILEIRTHYEDLFTEQGFSIKYLSFVFD